MVDDTSRDAIQSDSEQNIEHYINELNRVIAEMEAGDIDQLNVLLENFEYGSTLIKKCNSILKDAEMRVNKISEQIKREIGEDND